MERLYLDHAATAPLLPRVREVMAAALESWANPSSPHAEGRAARAALERAREAISTALGWRHALLFTSGASEAIGMVFQRAAAGRRLISAVEHDAVKRQAGDAAVVPVDRDGVLDLAALERALEAAGPRPLVAVQAANSEIGVLQPLAEVAQRVRAAGGLLLADCSQTAGKLPPPDCDFAIVSAHKLGGPPGIGALLVRDLATLTPCGGQEQGYRMGTENLPAILGFAAALEGGRGWAARAAELRAYVDNGVEAAGGIVVAPGVPRIPTIGAYRMPGMGAEAQLIRFDLAGIAISAGSACASGSLKASPVLAALGMPEEEASEVIRMSFGRATGRADLWRFIDAWKRIAGEAGRRG